jgi:YfiH family protein
MQLYNAKGVSIYFGDSSDQLFMNDDTYNTFQHTPSLLKLEPFSHLAATMPMAAIQFPRQVHGAEGFIVGTQTNTAVKPFSIQSDYIITNSPNIGIGILTADCLPILFYDPQHEAVAAVHAGWRGSVAGIAIKALKHMVHAFSTDPSHMRVFFGPAAGQCCYSVGNELIQAVNPYAKQVLQTRNNTNYFDLPGYNRLLLEHAGVPPTAFCNEFAQCTICNKQFWSYRRQQQNAGRQMTVICLTQ